MSVGSSANYSKRLSSRKGCPLSINWQLDAEPSPAILVLPRAAASLDEAHAAIELWEHYSRKRADPTQRLAVEVMMAQRSDGRWAAGTTGREMPRQNGKGDELEIVELWGLVQRGESILHTIHDAVLLATQTQQRMLGVLEGHPDLRSKVKRRWMGTGQQMIEMRNGGIIWYRTRTGGGGRGVDDIDRLVIDESQHATEEQLAALTPTLFVNSNPQMNVVGTAGLEGKSAWWWQIRRRALAGDNESFGYVGHTAETIVDGAIGEPPDVQDRSTWVASNPALSSSRGVGRMEFLEGQLANLGPSMFAQEHLCVWAPQESTSSVIALDKWNALEDKASEAVGRVVLALDVSPDRKWATISAAGRRDDGLLHVESVTHKPGTSWVVAEVPKRLIEAGCQSIRIEKGGPAASLISQLAEVGITVDEVSTADHARATGQFIDAVIDGSLRHLGQQSLRSAVVAAKLRATGDSELWSRRSSKMDITPLVAATLALGGVPEPADATPGVFMAFT